MTDETITAHGHVWLRMDLVKERWPSDMFGEPVRDAKPSRFDDFWAAWPPRHGRRLNKATAEKMYAKAIKTASEETIIEAAKSYGAHCKKTDTYPMDAHRWLRKQLWTEETPEKKAVNADVLRFWAEFINSDKPIFNDISAELQGKLVAAKLVTPERMMERFGN